MADERIRRAAIRASVGVPSCPHPSTRHIDTDIVRRRAAAKAETDAIYAALRRHLTTGGPNGGPAVTPPPATIMSRLTDAQQEAVRGQVDAAIEGRTTGTDPQTWHAIREGLTGDDAGERQRWASASLVPFMGRLSAEDYAVLETLLRDTSPTVMSDIPSTDDALHEPGAQLAQTGPEDDRPPRPDDGTSASGRELHIDVGRMRQPGEEETAARSAVHGNMTPVEIDRWISDWLSSYRPEDAAPPQMPAGLAERLTPGQRTEIEDIVSGGADTKTNPRVFEEIRRGLRSSDAAERLEWANVPLYRYRPWLSPGDYQQLTIEQAQIDPLTGATNGAVGRPVGTLEDNADLAVELSAAPAVRWVYRAGQWILEKVGGSDAAPAGRDVATTEGLSTAGVGGGAAEAAESALSVPRPWKRQKRRK